MSSGASLDETVASGSSSQTIKQDSISVSRQYRLIKRQKAAPVGSNLKTRRKGAAESLSEEILRRSKCCKMRRCFSRSNIPYLKAKVGIVSKLDNRERRKVLMEMLCLPDHESGLQTPFFVFDGRRVCAAFLNKAFRFSRDLQCSVKMTPGSMKRTNHRDIDFHDQKTCGRDSIISFLRRLADKTAGKMPDKQEQHLPFFKKAEVYRRFEEEHAILYSTEPPTPSYFYSVWKSHCSDIKVRKTTRFAKCDVCEELRAAILSASGPGSSTVELINRRKIHVARVSKERQEYQSKMESAILHPDQYCSICVDGADQSAFGLPHFTVQTKSVRGKALKVKLIGILEHSAEKRLHLYTMTEEYETGANHIVESVHRFINERASGTILPPILYIQLDNCTRENKNRYFLSYLECLVSWKVFSEVHASFLPVGHTHSDIDQCFSCTSRRLRSSDAITLHELHTELRASYTPSPTVSHIKKVANFSGLCKQEKNLTNMRNFSHFQYFKFNRLPKSKQSSEGFFETICYVKTVCDGDWVPLGQHLGKEIHTFLKNPPDLGKTPPTSVTCPEGLDEVEARLRSEEGRINCEEKMAQLRDLASNVFRSRLESFHWDIQGCVEGNGFQTKEAENDSCEESEEEIGSYQAVLSRVRNNYGYERNRFVAVRPSNSTAACPFWIARVLEVINGRDGVPRELIVQWYEPNSGRDVYHTSYSPSFISKQGTSHRTAWRDNIPADSVIVEFADLTKKKELGMRVQKLLRREFCAFIS